MNLGHNFIILEDFMRISYRGIVRKFKHSTIEKVMQTRVLFRQIDPVIYNHIEDIQK